MGANPNIFQNKENRRVVPPGDENFFVTAEEFQAIDTAFGTKADQTALDAIDGRLDTAEGDITGLQTQVGIIEGNLTIAEGNIGDLLGDVSALQTDTTPTAIVGKLESITDENQKLQASAIGDFSDAVNSVIDLTQLETRIATQEALNANLAVIQKFDERNEDNGRTRFKKLIFNEDTVITTDNVHTLPSYRSSSLLPSVWPNTLVGDLVVTTDAGYTVRKPMDGSFGRFVSVLSNVPREYFNPATGEYEGLLIEPQYKYLNLYTNDYSNGVWTFTEASRSTSAIPSAIDGRFYEQLFETAVSNSHRIRQNTGVLGTSVVGVWVTCLTPKTGNLRNLGLNIGNVGGTISNTIRVNFNPTDGTFPYLEAGANAALLIDTAVEDFGDAWYFGMLVTPTTDGTIRPELYLRIGAGVSSYAGDPANFILFDSFQCVEVDSLSDPMPRPVITGASAIDRAADLIRLTNWVTKGFMGVYSGQARTLIGDDEIIDSWEGDQLTVITNGVPAAPVTQAIPTDYTLRTGKIKSFRVKKISDDAPDIPIGIDFDTQWGFASLYNPVGEPGGPGTTGVTGGYGGTVITVTNEAEFEAAWERTDLSSRIIRFSTNITLNLGETYTNTTDNWTLESTNGSQLIGGELRCDGCVNFKIRNIVRKKSGNDLLAFQNNCEHWWIDHVEFDGEFDQVVDGLLDGKRGIDYGAITFCKFKDQNQDTTGEGKVSLFGLSLGQSGQTEAQTAYDIPRFRITLYGNEYNNNYQRQHRVVYGKYDQACCYYTENFKCWQPFEYSEVIVRNTYFENSSVVAENNGSSAGKIRFDNCLFVNISNPSTTSNINASGITWEPDDFYTNLVLVSAADAKQFVSDYSGAILHTL